MKIKVKLVNCDKHLFHFLIYLQNTDYATAIYPQITKNRLPTPHFCDFSNRQKIPIVKLKVRICDYNMQESSKNQQYQLSSPVPTESP